MNQFQTIALRHSTRTYNGLRPDAKTLEAVAGLCRRCSNESNELIPAVFADVRRPVIALIDSDDANVHTGTYGMIKGARAYLAMSAGKSEAEQVLAGFMFELALLGCTAMGLDSCWLGGTFSKSDFTRQMAAAGTDADMQVTVVSPIGHGTPKERWAGRLMRKLASSASRKPFGELFEGINPPDSDLMKQLTDSNAASPDFCDCEIDAESAAKAALSDAGKAIATALECVRLAPSSRNSQPWRAKVTCNADGTIGQVAFSCATSGRFSAVDMGIAYCHFCLAAKALGLKGNFTIPGGGSALSMIFTPAQ